MAKKKYKRPDKKLFHPIRELRERKAFSQIDVEHATQRICDRLKDKSFFISKSRLYQIEEQKSAPSPSKIAALAYLYNVTVDDLLDICPHWYRSREQVAAESKAEAEKLPDEADSEPAS